MGDSKDGKRRKERPSDDDEYRKEKKSKRARTRSRSPEETRERVRRRKRRYSRSKSQEKSVKQEKQAKEAEVKKELPERKNKETDMLNTRTGGAYIPPARLRLMQAQITDKSSAAYQRIAWEALKKSIHGHINKINVGNIGIIIKQLLKENIVRGRGLLCRSVIQAQAASPTFTNVYAALVAAVNSRFPNIGELLLKRLVIQFKRGFKRNDKPICISSATFIAHLVNQRVAHEILALELLTLLVETPTDDSVEVAIAFLKECGQKLTEVSSKGVNAIFEMLRNILHEGKLDKRVQYMIEVMFQVWKDGFKDHPALIEELELVPEEEQFTHLLMLDDATDPQDILNVFKFDEKYEENEQKYKTLCKEILGSDAESDGEEGSEESGSGDSEEEDEDDPEGETKQKGITIIDNTETNLIALRRTIYLTINSSLDFEECAHKLMKMQLQPGQEVELCHMFLDCCAEQRTYEKFYGLLAQRFCNINRMYIGPFEDIFKDSYATAHRLDTNRLRNVSKFFAHLLFTDSISWEVMECVRLNEEDTSSSSRIYIKILFQELAEYMGLKKLNDRLKDPTLQEAFSGVFPRDNPKNSRFSINFFTSIGLGGLTDELREHLKQMPKNVPAPVTEINIASESSSDSSSSSSDSDSSSDSSDSSESGSEKDKNKKKKDTKKKQKDKEQDKSKPDENEPQKETERWGHDGFYDTYGNDARRHENRSRDDNNFVRPRDVRQNDDRRGVPRNGDPRAFSRNADPKDDRRKDDFRNRNDDKRNDDHRNRNDNRQKDDYRNRNDDRQKDDYRNRNDERQKDDYRNRNDDRQKDDYRNRNDDRQKDDNRNRNDDRQKDDFRNRNDDKRNDDHRNRNDDRQKDDNRNRNDDRQKDDYRNRNDDRQKDDNRNRNDDRQKDDYRNRNDDRQKDDFRNRNDDRQKDDYRNRNDDSRKEDDRRNVRDDKYDKEYSKIRRDESERRSERNDTERRRGGENNDREKERDESKRLRDRSDHDSRRDDESRSNKDEQDRSRRVDDERRKEKSRNDDSKRNSDKESSEEESSKKHKKSKKHKRKSNSSDEGIKERKKKDKKSKRDNDSSEEESRSRKNKRKDKGIDTNQWDIRRASSIRREVPDRYWN